MTRTLYDLTGDMLALDALIDEVDGDLSDPRTHAVLEAFFAEVQTSREAKVDGYCALVAEHEARAAADRASAKALTERARVAENVAVRLRTRLLDHMEATGTTKLVCPRFTASTRMPGGVAKLVLSDDVEPTKLPAQYQRTVVEVDTDEVRRALDAGGELYFAHYAPKTPALVIK